MKEIMGKRITGLILVLLVMASVFLAPIGNVALAANSNPKKYRLEVDVPRQKVRAYTTDSAGDYTVLVREMICSSGKPSTPTRQGTHVMGKTKIRFGFFVNFNCYAQYWSHIVSRTYFHSILYRKRDTSTVIQSSVNNLGRAVSHGCVRLRVADAKWIYENCPAGTICKVGSFSAKNKVQTPDETMRFSVAKKQGMKLYSKAAVSSKELATLNIGDEFEYVKKSGNYCQVKYNGKTGYMLAKYSKIVTKCTGKWATITGNTKAYNSASTSSAYTSVESGRRIGVVKRDAGNGFTCVAINGQKRYILTKFLQFDKKGDTI